MSRSRFNHEKVSTAALLMLGMLMLSSFPAVNCAHKSYLRTEHHPKPLTLSQTSTSIEFPRLSEYHGLAYDMFTGNPKGETVDLGFQPKAVFELTYDKKRKSADDLFFIPDQVTVVGDMSCTFASTSSSYTGMSSYQSDLSASVALSGSYEGVAVSAAFSASAEYNQMKNSIQEEEKVAIVTQARCNLYQSSLMEKARLSEDFKQAIDHAYSKKSFDKFIVQWGTHFAHEVEFGATAIQRSFFTRKDVQDLESMGVNVAGAVSASGFGAQGSVSLEASYSKEQASKFSSTSREVRESYIGLAPPESGDAREWLSNVRSSDPVPINFKLRAITDIINKDYFGDTYTQAQLDEIKNLIKSAILIKSTKSNLVGPSDDTLNFDSRISSSRAFGTPFSTTDSKYFKDPIMESPQLRTKRITVNAGDAIDAIHVVLTDGVNDFDLGRRGGAGGWVKTFDIPSSRSIDYLNIWPSESKGIIGLEFYLDDGTSSPHYGGREGEKQRVDIKGHIIALEGMSDNLLRGIKFVSRNTQYVVIAGFSQLKTKKVGEDEGIEFRDVDRPLPEFKSKQFKIYTRDGKIEGIQAILAMRGNGIDSEIVSEFHGLKAGTENTYNVPSDKYITTVKIWKDSTYVKGIQFVLIGKIESSIYGVAHGDPESLPINGHITGFYGYHTRFLRSLGVMYTAAI